MYRPTTWFDVSEELQFRPIFYYIYALVKLNV